MEVLSEHRVFTWPHTAVQSTLWPLLPPVATLPPVDLPPESVPPVELADPPFDDEPPLAGPLSEPPQDRVNAPRELMDHSNNQVGAAFMRSNATAVTGSSQAAARKRPRCFRSSPISPSAEDVCARANALRDQPGEHPRVLRANVRRSSVNRH